MAVPKNRMTSTRTGNRRSHLALKKQILSPCAKCNESKIPHTVCPTCGTYDDVQVIDFTKKDKKNSSK